MREKYFAGGRWTTSEKYWPFRHLIHSWHRYRSPKGATILMPMRLCQPGECSTLISLYNGIKNERVRTQRCRPCRNKLSGPFWGKPYSTGYVHLISKAKTRKITHFLTYDEYIAVLGDSPKCHYCHQAIVRVAKGGPKKNSNPIAARTCVDRVDNDVGYIKSNLVPCCWACNVTKGGRLHQQEMRIIAALRRGRLDDAMAIMHEQKDVIRAHSDLLDSRGRGTERFRHRIDEKPELP